MNPISIRLLAQQLVSPQYSAPADVVAHMGAIQAQDYRMMRWAVQLRMRKPSAEAFAKAFDEGEIIRLHLLRGTWQLVAAADYWWLLQLYAPKAERVIRGWMKSNGVAIDDHELHRVREVLALVCEAVGSATKADFAQALEARGMGMDDHRLSYHIRLAELGGTLCSGNLTPMKATYALVERKLGTSASEMSRDDMLRLLARKYFQSRSAATFEDFLWWTGLGVAECKRGMELLGSELRKMPWKGYELYVHEACRTRGARSGCTHLLPPFDEYLIGYKSREIAMEPAHYPHAFTRNGIFFPVIAHGGVVCGNWSPWERHLKTSYFVPTSQEPNCEKNWKSFCRHVK